jgi:DNA (cytosine-5)-methyltransferase 1
MRYGNTGGLEAQSESGGVRCMVGEDFQQVAQTWPEIISQYWVFVEGFRGNPKMGRGDARAYISALADIIAVQAGVKDVEGFRWALSEALRTARRGRLTEETYERTLREWRSLDRGQLRFLVGTGTSGLEHLPPRRDTSLCVVSLFTGSYGLDLGFEYAGFQVVVAVDIDPASEEILRANRPSIPFIREDIARVPTKEILSEAGLGRGEVDVVTGGPPCQPFSTAGKRQGLRDPRSTPLKEFIRVVNEAQPRAFVMEEVTGLLNARLRHVPIRDRNRPLSQEELPGSVWRVVLDELGKTGYRIAWGILNAADFGVPQVRQRVFVIGLRRDLNLIPQLPHQTHSKPGTPTLFGGEPWKCLLDALPSVSPGKYLEMPPKYRRYISYVPPGGNWRQIPKDVVEEAMNGAFRAGGGRMGFYRRLTWFEPSPTLVTSPVMKGSMLVHPLEDRPLGINEYKVIQGFPVDWRVPGPLAVQYRKVGEAVPPLLSYVVASTLARALTGVG